jgi:hypothetical protein
MARDSGIKSVGGDMAAEGQGVADHANRLEAAAGATDDDRAAEDREIDWSTSALSTLLGSSQRMPGEQPVVDDAAVGDGQLGGAADRRPGPGSGARSQHARRGLEAGLMSPAGGRSPPATPRYREQRGQKISG